MATILDQRLQVERLTGRLGAELSNIDLGQTLSADRVEELKALLVEHKVLFFRDQHMNRAQHLALARRFGPLEIHPLTTKNSSFSTDFDGDEEVVVIESDATKKFSGDVWHTDVTWRAMPSLGSLLRCIVAPAAGGDTLWADMEAIYEDLPEDTKQRLVGLTATHDWHLFRRHLLSVPGNEELVARYEQEMPPQVHPVVRTHPVSGRKCLFVNRSFTVRINELPEAEGKALLESLYDLPFRPEYNVRFRWRAGSMAFWDNRSTQHYVASDFFPAHRLLERITIAGTERPF